MRVCSLMRMTLGDGLMLLGIMMIMSMMTLTSNMMSTAKC
jgi:hypothetical protein